MNLLNFTSEAVAFAGRLPKMRKSIFWVRISLVNSFSKAGEIEEDWRCRLRKNRKSHTFRTMVDERPGVGLEIWEGGII